MSVADREMPPFDADERAVLAGWLDFYRATLAAKCSGLDHDQVRTPAVTPSPITLLGLVRHLTEVERNWFRRVLTGEDVAPIYGPPTEEGHDDGFVLDEHATIHDAVAVWQTEIARSRENCAARSLDATSPFDGGQVTLRWICTHMIAEYARHIGHADLIRERIDGSRGF